MIKSRFSVIKKVEYDSKGNFQSCYAEEEDSFIICFSGNRVISFEGIDRKDLYARILLCWEDGLDRIFVVLKNNRIYNLDNLYMNEKYKMITYMVNYPELLCGFESLDDIEVFSKL
jgi:hypothetical protein